MENKVFKSSGLPIRRTVELLPEVFQTSANKKFLDATLDAMVQPGALEKLNGYVGRKYGKTYNTKDIYLDKTESLRDYYQLEPGVVVTNNDKVSNFYDYLDFKNQLRFFENLSDRDDLIVSETQYSWAPPIDWDKFVNYREYYWLPNGPQTVIVAGQAPEIISSYRVRTGDENEWIFYPDGLKKNPSITLYRGQTYEFDVNSPGDPFFIRTSSNLGEQSNYNKGLSLNGAEKAKVIFEVPYDAPDLLYYQSGTNKDRVGSFRIAAIEENSFLDIETDILGKQRYKSSNGVEFTNGLKIQFIGNTIPETYKSGSWIIEGVGTGIRLIPFESLEVPPISKDSLDVVFDNAGFDTEPFDEAVSYPGRKDYITINRCSIDKNPWSRYNRWFHKSVIQYSADFNRTDSDFTELRRAKRPIIEFKSDIQLFNHGTVAKQSVDLIDDFTTDVFSTIEGSAGYNVDGENLFDGARVLFTADTDPLVVGKIYQVKFITVQGSSNLFNRRQISLVEVEDTNSQVGECVIVKRGKVNGGKMYHYTEAGWVKSQEKLSVNQAPLFDVFDDSGNSFSDTVSYPNSLFKGCELVSYKLSSGVVDSELGLSLTYQNIDNVGDIVFEFDWDIDEFNWQEVQQIFSKKISTGYFRFNESLDTFSYKNCWTESDQAVLTPVIETVVVNADTNTVTFNAVIWDQITREKVVLYKNGIRLTDSFNVVETINGRSYQFENTSFSQGDAVTIFVYSDAEPNTGYYAIPQSLEKNPLNQNLETFTLGQVVDHVGSIVSLSDRVLGEYPGTSNLRDVPDIDQFGQRFVKHTGNAPAALSLLIDKKANLIKSINYASSEYEKFKNNFLNLAKAESLYESTASEVVDRIFDILSKAQTADSVFYNSDMVGSGACNIIEYEVDDTGINTFALSERFDLSVSSNKSVYVYINNEQLVVDEEYEFDSTFGFVRITKELAEGDKIQIKEYFSTSFNFVPPTPTKLGLYKKYTPKIFVDDTYLEPKTVIQGHDGSITLAFGDDRDAIYLELERRIYNNIKINYNRKIFNIDEIAKGNNGVGVFSLDEFNRILNKDFLNWSVTAALNLYENNFFDELNSFTYTLSGLVDSNGNSIPSFWRGIYQYFYDTDRPHTAPWEMLGFSQKPLWWDNEYGPAPYTSGNLILWEDLQAGVIRQGDLAGTYERYARPNLLEHLPVNEFGELLSPIDSGLIDYTSRVKNKDFKFGDWAPIEASWRKSSAYAFSVISAISILRPVEFISLSLDRSIIDFNKLGQRVLKGNKFIKLSDIAEANENSFAPTGLLYYVANYLKKDLINTSELSNLLTNIDVRLSHRLSGFVEKEYHKYLLDSKSPKAKSSNIFVPPENYNIIFNTSSPIRSISYSAVIVEKSENGWIIKGYDKLNSYFSYFPSQATNTDTLISVGGVSETFTNWDSSKFYGKGSIVRYENAFYRALQNHTSAETFNNELWIKISSVPVVGAIEAFKRTVFDRSQTLQLPYGTTLSTLQEVVDFLFGYGLWLESQGFVFDSFNTQLSVPNDWTTSVKEFMFWTSHNWAPGTFLSLSPAATELKIQNNSGVAESLTDTFYDYNVFKSNGTKLPLTNVDVLRDYNSFKITPYDTNDGIYFARIYYVLKEHVAIFDDKTIFNDVLFDKGPGYRQDRIKVLSFRTTDWNGDYVSPGFVYDNVDIASWQPYVDYRLGDIVQYKDINYVSKKFQKGQETFDQNSWERLDSSPKSGLVSNFEYKINQFEDYYDLDSQGIGSSQRELARHSIGYQSREYLQSIAEDEVNQFRIYQGFIRDKGTANALTKVFDKLSKVDDDAIVIDEEWALLTGTIGGTEQFKEQDVNFDKKAVLLNPQPVILDSRNLNKSQYQNYVLLDKENYISSFNPEQLIPVKDVKLTYANAGYVSPADIDFSVKVKDDILFGNISDFSDGTTVWVTFDGPSWNVLRYTITDNTVVGVAGVDNNTVSLVTNRVHDIKIGDIVGVTNILFLEGFYKVKAVGPKSILLDVDNIVDEPLLKQGFSNLGTFKSVRLSTKDQLTQSEYAKLPSGSKVWVDENDLGKWEVLQKTKQYKDFEVKEYGIPFANRTGSAVIEIPERSQILASIQGSVEGIGDDKEDCAVVVYFQDSQGLVPSQVIKPLSTLEGKYLGVYGDTMAVSADKRWLAVGSPKASFISSRYRDAFETLNSVYNIDDVVTYAGKLWESQDTIVTSTGPTETPFDFISGIWKLVTLHTANILSVPEENPGFANQGAVDLFEYDQNQWNYVTTIISPRITADEHFGKSIVFGKQEGIEGTSGDITITVREVNENGSILSADVDGISGLPDATYSNIGGVDISDTGSGASFDIVKTQGQYTITVRNTGFGYTEGDRLKVLGSQVGGLTPQNDILITVTKTNPGGELIGSDVYNLVTGLISRPVTELATFTVTRVRSSYSTVINNRGQGYVPRSIVRYNNALYACIRDTQIDRGAWKETETYYPGDVVRYPADSSIYYEVLKESTGVIPVAEIPPPEGEEDTRFYADATTIFPTNTLYWEPVVGQSFNLLARNWSDKDSNGLFIPYTSGTTILIAGSQLGGNDIENDLLIRVNSVDESGSILSFSTSGVGKSGISFIGTASAGTFTYNDITAQDISEPGTGAVFDIIRTGGLYTADVTVGGSRYVVGDQIRVLGTQLGGTTESYYMAISAPGAASSRGRVYLYKFNGIKWEFLEDKNYLGIFDQFLNYPAGSVVLYEEKYWKANSSYTQGDLLPGVESAKWTEVSDVAVNILPSNLVFNSPDLPPQKLLGEVEDLSPISSYGQSVSATKDFSTLVVGAPQSSVALPENYKGNWNFYTTYINNDVVRYLGQYYKLNSVDDVINEVPTSESEVWELQDLSYTTNTGAVYIYNRNSVDRMVISQVLSYADLPADIIETGDEFGYSVLITSSGDRLFVSAPDADVDKKDKGSVFVFVKNNAGQYVFDQQISSFSDSVAERFGDYMSLSPDESKLVVSASEASLLIDTTFDQGRTQFDRFVTNFKDTLGKTGKVYVFERYMNKFVLAEALETNLSNREGFGTSVYASNNSIVVGSPNYRRKIAATILEAEKSYIIDTVGTTDWHAIGVPTGVEPTQGTVFVATGPGTGNGVVLENKTLGQVRRFVKEIGAASWNILSSQPLLVDINLLKSIFVYDPSTDDKISDIDVIDPAKGKILSIANNEISFKTSYDPAVYNINPNGADQSSAWQDENVGLLWWNTSTAKWINYEQGSLTERIGRWNQLAPGASIDVYEWVESDYLPSDWLELSLTNEGVTQGITGVPLNPDNTVYSLKEFVDPITGLVRSRKYYFWVKDKTTVPERKNRAVPASVIANTIENPKGTGSPIAAFIDNNTVLFYNLNVVDVKDKLGINIQFLDQESVNNIHREYQLISEKDSTFRVPPEIENKWIDSIVGFNTLGQEVPDKKLPIKNRYGISNRPRQSMFVNRDEAASILIDRVNSVLSQRPFAENVNSDLLNSFEEIPSKSKNLYDIVVDTKEEIRFISTSKIKTAVLVPNVVNGRIDTVDIVDPGYGYRVPPTIEISGSGRDAKIEVVIDNLGRIVDVIIVNGGSRFLSASIKVRPFSVLVKSDSDIMNFWSIWELDIKNKEFSRVRAQSFDTRKYWTLEDWWETGFNESSRVISEIVAVYEEPTINVKIGELIRLRNYGSGGWAVFEKVSEDGEFSKKYRLVGRKLGSIQISKDLIQIAGQNIGYDTTQPYDNQRYDFTPSIEFRNILKSLKEDIFVDEFSTEWNKLFFSSLYYILSTQNYVDWIFKTSFITAIHNVGFLTKKPTYKNDNLDSYQDYVNEVKPYRTKVREYTSRYQQLELSRTMVSDFDLPPVYDSSLDKIVPVTIDRPEVLEYPRKNWFDNRFFSITDIKIISPGTGYTSKPSVVFEGGGGTGAEAEAFISNGKVSKIVVKNPGTGYTSTPRVYIVGGVGSAIENAARAIAIIGDTKARTIAVNMKFDRFSKTPTFKSFGLKDKFTESETFIGTGSKTVFNLKYPATTDKSKISVTVGGIGLLRSEYSISLYTVVENGLTLLRGRLIIQTPPAKNATVNVTYEKNDNILDSLNRIDKYYSPKVGMLGIEKTLTDDSNQQSEVKTDYSQLMTGFDFGGVIVQGTSLDVAGGWDSLPWFTETWDGAELSNNDLYIVSDGVTRQFELTEAVPTGQAVNVYKKTNASNKFIRIDDPNYDAYNDGDDVVIIDSAEMNTIYGNGTTQVSIPQSVTISNGDTLVFRLDTSDGSINVENANLIDTNISGGTLDKLNNAYTTATGKTVSEIVLDGEKFISPDQVPAPEENVPGQVVESLSLKVFHTNRTGAPIVLSKVYVGNNQNDLFDIGQKIAESSSVIVLVDKVRKIKDEDYIVNVTDNTVRLEVIPAQGEIVEIVSIGVGGVNILDYQEFIGDGTTRFFLTSANYSETAKIFALIDGEKTDADFIQSEAITNVQQKTMVEFGDVPPADSKITLIVLSGELDTIIRINTQEIPLVEGQRNYVIENFVEESTSSATGNSIVELNGKALTTVDVTEIVFDGTVDILIGQDPLQASGNIVEQQVFVYQNNNRLTFGRDYLFSTETKLVTLISKNIKVGDIIKIENYSESSYTISGNTLILSDQVIFTAGDNLVVTWFDNYASLNIVKDQFTGGKVNYTLQKDPVSISYIWVYLNGDRLTQDIDFWIDYPRRAVYLQQPTTEIDKVEIICFSTNVYTPPFAYEIFKDVLNNNHFNRFNVSDVVLAQPLNYFDEKIVLNDASTLPVPKLKQPGIVYINGERIEYLRKVGNELLDLRRGLYGTSISGINVTISGRNTTQFDSVPYPAGTPVVNVGYTEKIPYSENQFVEDFIADGARELTKVSTRVFEIEYDSIIRVGNADKNNLVIKVYTNLENSKKVLKFIASATQYSLVNNTEDSKLTVEFGQAVDIADTDTVTLDSLTFGNVDFVPSKSNRTNWVRNTIPSNYGPCDQIEVFVAGQRLRKDHISLYDYTLADNSPAGDVVVEAEFSVNGEDNFVRLTNPAPAGTRIRVVRRTGRTWYTPGPNSGLTQSTTPIAKFLQEKATKLP